MQDTKIQYLALLGCSANTSLLKPLLKREKKIRIRVSKVWTLLWDHFVIDWCKIIIEYCFPLTFFVIYFHLNNIILSNNIEEIYNILSNGTDKVLLHDHNDRMQDTRKEYDCFVKFHNSSIVQSTLVLVRAHCLRIFAILSLSNLTSLDEDHI